VIEIGLGIGVDAEHGHTSGAYGALKTKNSWCNPRPPTNARIRGEILSKTRRTYPEPCRERKKKLRAASVWETALHFEAFVT
jgi:hypothetical protein